jgi:hypothetical protein
MSRACSASIGDTVMPLPAPWLDVLEPLLGAAVLAVEVAPSRVLDLLHAVTLNAAATNNIHRTFFMGGESFR